MILSDYVSIDANVARSVNIERDMGDDTNLRQYYLTGKGLEIISRLTSALNGERVSAWSLTGPYGMGKSSFANFLLALCGPSDENDTRIARKMLDEKDHNLAKKLRNALAVYNSKTKGLFRVPVTSSFESINRSLSKGLQQAMIRIKHKHGSNKTAFGKLLHKVNKICREEFIETLLLVELYKEAGRLYRSPVAVFIDEFGKNLEFMARYPAKGDLYILQALAETDDIYLWVCLHQAFEEYASGLTNRQFQEWGKVQGRFEDISFVEPTAQMIQFIGKTLVRKNENSLINRAVSNWAKTFHAKVNHSQFPEMFNLDVKSLERFYPLHPLVVLLLPELCVRFAQNDRTLFSFLCSGEPNALPSFLSTQTIDLEAGDLSTFGPEHLYDYFLSSVTSVVLNRPESQRWLEIHDLIERSRHLDPFYVIILKVTGLLNLFSGPSGFKASSKILPFAFLRPFSSDGLKEKNLQKTLSDLIEKGILIYRDYADEYRLWEGTDFDIPAAIRKRKDSLAVQPLTDILEKSFSLSPLTASRHSYETGTLRHFERKWCSLSELQEITPECSSDDVDGLILYCFGKEAPSETFPFHTKNGRPIVIGYAKCEEQLREMILDVAASKAVLKEASELLHDGVARKEASFRAQVAEDSLRRFVSDIFSPGNTETTWYADNQARSVETGRDLSSLLSSLCNQAFPDCPVIRNELINRNQLSSAAARARRELMDAMLAHEGEENLGMQGTGPEVAIYRTMLKAEGLHRKGKKDYWQLVAPEPNTNFFPVWNELIKSISKATDREVQMVSLVERLRHPPFGMREGPIFVLICLVLAVHSDEIALYQEGAFVPFLGPEDMELMVKRPEYFSVRKFTPMGIQGKVFRIYRDLLNTSPINGNKKIRNATMVSVVGPLVQFAGGLPEYVLHTRIISKEAQNVRRTLLNAKDPIQLLFTDLPKAVGLHSFSDKTPIEEERVARFQKLLRVTLVELTEALPRLLRSIQTIVVETFGEGYNIEPKSVQTDLNKRAKPLVLRCADPKLKPFVAALAGSNSNMQDWLTSLAAIVNHRPVDVWRDNDLQLFSTSIHDFANRFQALEAIVTAELKSPVKTKGKVVRYVSMMNSSGSMPNKLFRIDKANLEKMKKFMRVSHKELSHEELEALFILLGEKLLQDDSIRN